MDQKLPHQSIAGLVQGLVFDGYYLLNDIRVKMSRAGNPYLSGSLMDTSGNIPVVIWNYTGEITADDAGKVVFVDGTVDEYNSALQVVAKCLVLANEGDEAFFDTKDLLPFAQVDCQQCLVEVRRMLESLDDRDYREIALAPLNVFSDILETLPAAKSIHHAYLGGWLVHTYGMMTIADQLCKTRSCYHNINRSLLIAGCFLHDIGKIDEFKRSEYGLVADYTVCGKLITHPVLGAFLLQSVVALHPVDKIRQLQHIILSHHGQPEYGAAVLPQTIEAEIVHYLDGIDSRLDIYTAALSKTKEGNFSEYIRALDKRIYHVPA